MKVEGGWSSSQLSHYYPQQQNSKYAKNRGCMGPIDVLDSLEKRTNLLTMLGIKIQFFGCALSNLVTVKFMLSQLPRLLQM
jgi:hypothetical protein